MREMFYLGRADDGLYDSRDQFLHLVNRLAREELVVVVVSADLADQNQRSLKLLAYLCNHITRKMY